MNLAFFLTPVARVACLEVRSVVADAVHALRQHRFTAVPLIDARGHYVGTLTEGDLLFYLADAGPPGDDVPLSQVPRRLDHHAVGVDTDIRQLLAVAAEQNFVPVVDSRGVLMGIVTRKAILAQCEQLLAEHGLLPAPSH